MVTTMSAPVHEGEVLAGKYRVDKVLGIGGMGVVVAAHHLQLDEKVALKFLLPEMLSDAEAVGRFEREARAAVKIKSEHVARVSDVGKLESGSPYMVMEYLDGGDLAAWLEQRGALPIEQAVEFVLQACEAIGEAHALGIIHRDLKPANLFCVRRADGVLSIKVLDFGISKMTALGGSGPAMSMTKTHAIMGSPFYMSPEQMQSAKAVDPRADLWALGVILYELLTGRVPFDGEGLPELILKVVSAEPAPMRDLRPDLPDGLEAVVLRCLAKDRERRWSNVAELAVALADFAPKRARGSVERVSRLIHAAGLSTRELAPLSSGAPTAVAAAGTVGAWGQTKPGGGRGKLFVGMGAVLVVGAAAALLLTRGSHDTGNSAAAAASGDAVAASLAPTTAPSPSASGEAVMVDFAATAAPSAIPIDALPVVGGSAGKAPAKGAPSATPATSAAAPAKAMPSAEPAAGKKATPTPASPDYNPLGHL
jgi:serine/threonine-protein kinase